MNLVWTDLGASAYTKQARTPMYLVRGAAILHAGESSPRCGRSAPRGGGRGSAPTQRGLRCPPPLHCAPEQRQLPLLHLQPLQRLHHRVLGLPLVLRGVESSCPLFTHGGEHCFVSQGVLLATGALTAPRCWRIQETEQRNCYPPPYGSIRST